MDGEDDERQRQKGRKDREPEYGLEVVGRPHISAIASAGPVKAPAVSSD
jgi:hypothetical protein